MKNEMEITIQIYISNFKSNSSILAVLSDATVTNENDEEELLLTYNYYPHKDNNGSTEYQFRIYKGDKPEKLFGACERNYINLKVIKALRDVEGKMKNSRKSPVKKLLDDYSIDKEDLERIAEEYKKSGEEIISSDSLKVDDVSSATLSSAGIINAIASALKKAER